MRNNVVKKLTALLITAAAITTSAMPVFAQNYTAAGTADIKVTAEVSSSFIVGLPTSVTLTNDSNVENDRATGAYTITVSGDIDPRYNLNVAPTDALTEVEGINFNVAQTGNTTNTLQVNVTDPKTLFSYSEVNATQSVNCDLVTVHRMAPGEWSGTLTYNISLTAVTP